MTSDTATREPPVRRAMVRQSPAGRRWGRFALATITLIAGLLWYSSHRVGLGPAGGVALSGSFTAIPSTAATIRLGTFNIHGGKGTDHRRDLDRIAAEIEPLDLVGLNEVEGPFLWENRDQAEELGRKLRRGWLFAPGERRWWHYDYGNGILTSLPVTGWQRIPLPRAHGKGFRNLLLVRAVHRGRPLNVLISHIDRSDERARREQMRFVADVFLALSVPAVLLGDMNSDAGDPEVKRLLETPGVVDPFAVLYGDRFGRHIDWILLRGLEVRSAGMNPPGASDHPCMWADVALPIEVE